MANGPSVKDFFCKELLLRKGSHGALKNRIGAGGPGFKSGSTSGDEAWNILALQQHGDHFLSS